MTDIIEDFVKNVKNIGLLTIQTFIRSQFVKFSFFIGFW